MGVAFITGMQGDDPHYWKTVATAKHFAVHSGPEADRHTFDARVSAHDLADTYLPHFEAAVREGRVASVMAAYNARQRPGLRRQPDAAVGDAARRWGFLGYVVGDCGAVDDVWEHHKLAASPTAAAAAALRAGTDLDCGRAYRHLDEAYTRASITEADLDRALVAAVHGPLPAGPVRSGGARSLVAARGGGDRVPGAPRAGARGRGARDRAAGEPRRRVAARGRRFAAWRWWGRWPTTCRCCSPTTTASRRIR